VKRYFVLLGIMFAALVAFALPAGADPARSDVLAQASPAPSPSPTPSPNPFQVSGFLDVGSQWASVANPQGVISGRVFDTVNNSAQLHALNLQAAYTGPIGGKVEFTIGDDAEYLHSYPQLQQAFGPQYPPAAPSLFTYGPGLTSNVDITQAYASGTFGPLTLILGKFATLAGAEVLESPSDLNYSRSILFGFAIPFTHTGARLTWTATPQITIIGGVNRGWDTTKGLGAPQNGGGTVGDNSSLTFEYGAAWNPSKAISVTAQGYSGKPQNWAFVGCASNTCNRNLIDLVGTWHATSALTGIVNIDLGSQSNTALFGGSSTATWKGVAGYASYAFTPKLTATGRYEWFSDWQGYRIGNFVGTLWQEGTITAQYAVTSNLTVRAEGRFDNASQPIFANRSGGFQKTNSSFGLEAIVHAP
jgi:hypothetical protein